MSKSLPTRKLRVNPDLEQLRRQAKDLLKAYLSGDSDAEAEVGAHFRNADRATFALHRAQLVIARSYGFESWPKLKAYVDGVTVRRLADAIEAGDVQTVEAMIAARPEVARLPMSYGDERQPIHFAVMKRSPEMVRLLMRHGADARSGVHPHRDATSAWTIAHERGYHEIAAIIEEEEGRGWPAYADPDDEPARESVRAESGEEGARSAAASGNLDWLRAQHAAGKLVNPVRWDGGGLLTVAVRNGRSEVLRLLLDFGFDPNERASLGEGDWIAYSQGYPLWHSAAHGKREMAEMLLRAGADPNVHVDSSGSAVYSAFSHRQWEMADLLLAHGGLVTADIAAIYRRTDVARELLANAPPESNVAAELVAFGADGGAAEIVRMALDQIDWPRADGRWFRCAANPLSFWHHIPWLYAGNKEFDREGYLACFRLILERCDPNIVAGFGRTLLHEVAAMGNWVTDEEAAAFATVLLDAGARPDFRDDLLKSTALGWASRWGRATIVRLLLTRGAKAVEPDAEPWAQPRAWAEKMGHAEIAQTLTQHEA